MHELVIVALVPVMASFGLEKRLGIAVALGSVAVAAVWYRYGIAPAERRRHR